MGKKVSSSILKRNGLRVLLKILPPEWKQRLSTHLGVPSLRWSLLQLKRFGFTPLQVMDVGAFKGDWAKICARIFPEARITCVEPQDEAQDLLQQLSAAYLNVHVIQTLLGRYRKDVVPFNETGPGSSVFLSGECGKGKIMETIDHLIDSGICNPPELLKLDVQGYEVEVLEGYKRYFNACQVIQCEISLLPLVPRAPLLHEMIAYLYTRDFVMFDLDELIRAPSDGAVWQIDALFCRIDSPLRNMRVWI